MRHAVSIVVLSTVLEAVTKARPGMSGGAIDTLPATRKGRGMEKNRGTPTDYERIVTLEGQVTDLSERVVKLEAYRASQIAELLALVEGKKDAPA